MAPYRLRAVAMASRTTGIRNGFIPAPCFPPFLFYRRNLAALKRIRAQLTGSEPRME